MLQVKKWAPFAMVNIFGLNDFAMENASISSLIVGGGDAHYQEVGLYRFDIIFEVTPQFLLSGIISDKGCDPYLPQHGGDVPKVIGRAEGCGAPSINFGLTPVFPALVETYGGLNKRAFSNFIIYKFSYGR